MIQAKVHSDDYKVEILFDAEDWFKQASDKEIKNLININFGGNFESDCIAEYYNETTTKRLFDYLSFDPTMAGDTVGFECYVDEKSAIQWLNINKPHLLPKKV